ncbi:unnamed protein product [Coffea canephora]|uniref:4-hydroxybenzoate polyprenyltransferase, mitochondrial n=1 Tax=Coffea canephora TaxID=49390 RepID=A0A068V4T2_COFCA|nr:unnamed protein product [Coffea canephora]
MSWGAAYSWAAVKGSLEPAIVFPLVLAFFFWTLEFDTIYAHQQIIRHIYKAYIFFLSQIPFLAIFRFKSTHQNYDKEDDVNVGIKSTALLFGDSTKLWISGFAAASIASLALTGFNANIGWPFYGLLAAASGHLAWQIWDVDLSNPADCSRKFVSNIWFGAIVFGAVLCGRLFS